MKVIIYSVLFFSPILCTLEKHIASELQKLGISLSRIDVNSSELGHIRSHSTREAINYLVNCSDGVIMAALYPKQDKISCKKKIFCLSDGAEGVYQHCSEKDIDPVHYHLLRILYRDQAMKKALQDIRNIRKIALE